MAIKAQEYQSWRKVVVQHANPVDDASEDHRVMGRGGHTRGGIAGVRDARYMPTSGGRRNEILESEGDQRCTNECERATHQSNTKRYNARGITRHGIAEQGMRW